MKKRGIDLNIFKKFKFNKLSNFKKYEITRKFTKTIIENISTKKPLFK